MAVVVAVVSVVPVSVVADVDVAVAVDVGRTPASLAE